MDSLPTEPKSTLRGDRRFAKTKKEMYRSSMETRGVIRSTVLFAGFYLGATSSASAQAFPEQLYERGHADVSVIFDAASDELDIVWKFDDAVVNGETISGSTPIENAAAITSATFERPSPDSSGRFSLVGGAPGSSVYYIPPDNSTATREGVPFMGFSNDVARGILRDNQVELTLKSVQSTSPFGTEFALWNISTLTPRFFMSSVDGIDASDKLPLSGHDHFFVTFGSSDVPAAIQATMEATAVKADGTRLSTEFDLSFLTCTPGVNCPEAPAPLPAPALGSLSGLLGLLLGASALGRRRKDFV